MDIYIINMIQIPIYHAISMDWWPWHYHIIIVFWCFLLRFTENALRISCEGEWSEPARWVHCHSKLSKCLFFTALALWLSTNNPGHGVMAIKLDTSQCSSERRARFAARRYWERWLAFAKLCSAVQLWQWLISDGVEKLSAFLFSLF